MPTVTTRNAQIRTAEVAIKTLTVSGRQVTQAVFRQLPETPLIGDDGNLRGLPWGRVNYHPDPKACLDAGHMHVVWQHGTDLHRATVATVYLPPPTFSPPSGAAYVDAYARETCWNNQRPKVDFRLDVARRVELGIPVALRISDEARNAVDVFGSLSTALLQLKNDGPDSPAIVGVNPRGSGGDRLVRGTAEQAVAMWRARLDECTDALGVARLGDAHEAVLAEVRAEIERRDRHRATRRALTDLPQLFIAV